MLVIVTKIFFSGKYFGRFPDTYENQNLNNINFLFELTLLLKAELHGLNGCSYIKKALDFQSMCRLTLIPMCFTD